MYIYYQRNITNNISFIIYLHYLTYIYIYISYQQQTKKDASKLQEFVVLNSTGFRKILKKYDKRLLEKNQERYLSSKVSVYYKNFHSLLQREQKGKKKK